MTETGELRPWDKQPGETPKAYEAFATYLNLGTDRSVVKVGRELGKTRSIIDRWSAQNDWVSRAEQWDAEQRRQEFAAQLQEAQDMGRRHAQIATQLQHTALQALRHVDPSKLAPGTILNYLMEATRLERLSRGEPEHIEEMRAKAEVTTRQDIRVKIDEYAPAYQDLVDKGILRSPLPPAPPQEEEEEAVEVDWEDVPGGELPSAWGDVGQYEDEPTYDD